MGKIGLGIFVGLYWYKVELLGITGAGLLTLGQMLFAGWLDQRSTDREIDKLPYRQYVGPDGVVVREHK